MLAAIDQIFDETETKCRNVVAQLPDGVYEAEAFARRRRRASRASRCAIHAKVTVNGGDMTIDLSGCSAERKAGDQLAHACRRARRLQGADRRRSIRSTKARSARSRSIIPEGNIMMARFPAPMAGWSVHRADGGRHHRHGAGAGDAGPRAGRPSRAARRRGGVLRRRIPRPSGASWCRASRAAAGAGGRSRTASPAPSRSARATCATARSRASS